MGLTLIYFISSELKLAAGLAYNTANLDLSFFYYLVGHIHSQRRSRLPLDASTHAGRVLQTGVSSSAPGAHGRAAGGGAITTTPSREEEGPADLLSKLETSRLHALEALSR